MNALLLVPLACAALAGYLGWSAGGGSNLVWLVPLAVINVFIVGSLRMKQAREAQSATRPNVIVEGGYLFVLQILILGMCYLLGFLIANAVRVV